jgi:formate dehydrogenase
MQQEHWDKELLEEVSSAMVDASICGLGQAAPNPIRMIIKHFAKEI